MSGAALGTGLIYLTFVYACIGLSFAFLLALIKILVKTSIAGGGWQYIQIIHYKECFCFINTISLYLKHKEVT